MKRKILLFITLSIFSSLLMSEYANCQNSNSCKKWTFSVTVHPLMKSKSGLIDSIIYNIYQNNSDNLKLSLHFSIVSFEDKGKFYMSYTFDSASEMMLKAGVDEQKLKDQNGVLQIDLANGTLTGDSIYKNNSKISFLKDTIVNNSKNFMYRYKDCVIISPTEMTSVEKYLLSFSDSKFLKIYRGNLYYRFKLIDNNFNCDKNEILNKFSASGAKFLSKRNMGLIDYFLFNK